LLVNTRSSPKTVESISWASSTTSTGRINVVEMCSPQRTRNVREEARAIKKAARFKARRWVVERSHSWMNRFRRILVR
jgi:hypothetical protein